MFRKNVFSRGHREKTCHYSVLHLFLLNRPSSTSRQIAQGVTGDSKPTSLPQLLRHHIPSHTIAPATVRSIPTWLRLQLLTSPLNLTSTRTLHLLLWAPQEQWPIWWRPKVQLVMLSSTLRTQPALSTRFLSAWVLVSFHRPPSTQASIKRSLLTRPISVRLQPQSTLDTP